jgi:PAP2 superfamily
VPNIMWTWQQAAAVAAVLGAAWAAAARWDKAPRTRPFLRESALIIGLYGLWQLAGALAGSGTYAAVDRGAWIWRAERDLHLPSEATVQRLILPHPLLVQAANLYYDTAHFTVIIIFLIWLFVRHRDAYPGWRTTLGLLTAGCLIIQFIPVAPPRMVPGDGIVDTPLIYHQSVYGSTGGFDPDQLSSMPSVHVAWALLVAICMLRVSTSRWRYLGIAHAAATVFVVVATGNHYWADGIVAVAVLVAAAGVQRLAAAGWARLRAARPLRALDPPRALAGAGAMRVASVPAPAERQRAAPGGPDPEITPNE